jgi:hypothetical protein
MNKDIIRRPFPPELVKQREGQDGKMLSYIETHAVIERLNEGCDAWDFEVVEHRVFKTEVVVVGKLVADGVTKMAFGGAAITFNTSGKVVSLADDLKAAASDALKKCASLLGVGLELYARKSAAPGLSTPPGTQTQPARDAEPDAATDKQLSAIQGICRRKRVSRGELAGMIERRTGTKQLSELTRREASGVLSELANLNGAHA